ncbi:MAG: hypothetical protein IJ302_03925, partial [Clostridia bacterium]|nr:hypothetical protein [Clostridia bacterium]
AVLYDGNEVHSDMNIKHIAVDGDETNRALLWTGCGNPNEASKQANITIDVKPASGAQNLDAFVYDDYHGRDFVVSFDIRAVEHEPYSAVTTDLFRMTSFYTPNGADGKTVTYSECLLQMDGNTYKLSVPNAGGRKRPTLDAVVPADRFMNLAVHVHPAENTYDLYIDGVCAAEDIVFLSVSSKKLVGTYDETGAMVLSDKENPTEDFCLSYARLCNTNGWMIAGDLFYLDNVVMYFADEFSVK